MNTELMEALTILEKEKNISRDTMMDAIENSLISACKNHFGTSDNIKVIMNRETCDYAVYAEKEVVEEVFDPAIELTLEDAEEIDSALQIGEVSGSGTVQRVWTYCNNECEKPDSSEDPRGRKKSSIRSVF